MLMDGPADPDTKCQVSMMKAPPPVIQQNKDNQSGKKECSKDLGESACLAAGGTWVGGAVSMPYCNCK